MGCENDRSALLLCSEDQLFGILCPIICIIGVFELARHIRRIRRTGNNRPMRRMDTASEKSGDEQASGLTSAVMSIQPQNLAPLPSACDILQPLSHSLPLPPSGHLAAVLGEERRRWMSQTYGHHKECIQTTSSPSSGSGTSASGTLQSDGKAPSDIEKFPAQIHDLSDAASQTKRTAAGDKWEHPSCLEPGETQSVQKRSQEVQFLREVDEDGVRTWRRWVIEYS